MSDDLGQAQHDHWQNVYERSPHMYGSEPSAAARHAAEQFSAGGARTVLELGAGHGRDALWLAEQGFAVQATDFSATAVRQLESAAVERGIDDRVHTHVHDVRRPLAFADASIDGVFAHMLLCMALSTAQIHAVVTEIGRVLRPGGPLVYTVRHSGDAHYGTGISHGDDIYEHGGFAVHFFGRTLVDDLARGWHLEEVHSFTEGELPRRLWRVTMVRR
ncbi:SAM-dependent methyltransferase [Nocardiopsis gilva YIM 90087]|uniref:SAM-dependent methyltransferase n=1 Tax=Nocardiopsis gilva YIM 90087 TaxID=1235441 RepID=A0A223S7E0_9ACTN|nr:class I SAM-dependent methyltransferase [Nocardiopsis gilva]ASU84019.1 SAM-dependent methyltransferase [Nocardiopsis gilva YIM 90087]